MATSTKALFRGAATTTTTTTLYTVPAATTTVVTSILIANTGASAYTWTLSLNGTSMGTTVSIAANSTTVIDMKQVLAATQTIQGGASNTAVTFHISGIEVS
jgi:hypothetical protein